MRIGPESLAAALLLAGAGCSKAPPAVPQGTPVRVQAVESASGPGGIRYSANVTPRAQVDLSFKANGYVDMIKQVRGADGRQRDLQLGDAVAAGTVLARVRLTEYQDQVTKSQANLDKSNAALDKATADFRRATNLKATNSITGSDYDSAKQEYESAKAAVEGAKAQLNESQVNLGYATLTAPMAGVLLQRKIEVGSLVGPTTVGFVLADLSSVKVVFGVPDVMLGSVPLGHQIGVSTASVPGRRFMGVVTAVAPSANSSTRVSEVEITVPNPGGELRDGMVASLEVPALAAAGAAKVSATTLAVPLAAIVRGTQDKSGYAVFVATKGAAADIARLTPVELGQVVGNSILVTSGLQAGDRVIVSGSTLVRDGDPIRPLQ